MGLPVWQDTATGPGEIQLNSANAPPVKKDPDKKLNLEGPCYAYVRNFDKLEWFKDDNRITADGKLYSVNMSYLPIVDGKLGPKVEAVTTHMTANFITTPSGRSQLSDITTTDGVYYMEEEGNWFAGDKLFYNAATSLLRIIGSSQFPCRLNGADVPQIEYNLETGEIKTQLTTTPGAITLPAGTGKK